MTTHPAPSGLGFAAGSRWLVGIIAGVALLALALPLATGVPWAITWTVVSGIPTIELLALVVLWAVGLLSHTVTLTAALPTLTHRQALALSLTGSAVANVLPLGGAAGIALNYRMVRHWGFDRQQFATYTVVTNAWDIFAKMVLPLAVVPMLVGRTDVALGPVLDPALAAAAGLAVFCGLVAVTLWHPGVAARVGSAVDRVVGGVLRRVRSSRTPRIGAALVELQASCSYVVRTAWLRLSLGMTLYTTLLFALLWACLWVTGAGVTPVVVLAGFTVERLLTLAGLTPGGAGVVEVGLTGVLIALGGSPAGVVAGVLVYRALTFGLEIPVGGISLAAWLWLRRTAATRSPRPVD
jgi:uncharacterized membrane protein YbhN (UPF0104 family)